MRNRNTVEFLGIWETLHNPNFNPLEFEGFRKEAGLNAFTLSPTRWIEATNAIGIAIRAEHIRTANHPSSISNDIFQEVLVKVIYTTRKMLAPSEHYFRQFCERKTVQKFFNCHSGIPDLLIISI